MVTKLVSIIIPCYNGEKYITYFLNSVLMQDYKYIELIFVDDGSTDRTSEIIAEYKTKFEDKGYNFIFINQENKGQAAAINRGLEVFQGEYVMWVDCDDILLADNVSSKVEYLITHPAVDFVICEGDVVDADNEYKKISTIKRVKPEGKDTFFEDLLLGRNVVFCPGVYMVRRNALLKALPSIHIYESREGPNWQLLLPLAYHCKCGYIQRSLFQCVAHSDSHSRYKRTWQQEVERNFGFIDLLEHVIKEMQVPNAEKILDSVRLKYAKAIIGRSAYFDTNEYSSEIKMQYNLLKKSKELTMRERGKYMAYKIRKSLYCLKTINRKK